MNVNIDRYGILMRFVDPGFGDQFEVGSLCLIGGDEKKTSGDQQTREQQNRYRCMDQRHHQGR
ncbi:MAG: hypothetical protein MIO90_07535 [Methanomassiliicoccales archaeon]|nr:hypothetical protein [Methanomassiliicoccales archaeon]